MRNLALISSVLAAMAASSASGQPLVGDVVQGHTLARKICADCHSVEKGQAANNFSPAPAFKAIADTPSTTVVSLRVFLRTPHRNMPNVMLSEFDTDDIIGYILSLK